MIVNRFQSFIYELSVVAFNSVPSTQDLSYMPFLPISQGGGSLPCTRRTTVNTAALLRPTAAQTAANVAIRRRFSRLPPFTSAAIFATPPTLRHIVII